MPGFYKQFITLFFTQIHMSQIIITTPRLLLRKWEPGDFEPFAALNADKETMRYFPSTSTAKQTLEMIERIKAHFELHGFGVYAVERKDNQKFIGYIGFDHPRFETYFTPCVEIGWRLSKENWGKGFATEGAKACIDHGFKVLNLKEIYSWTAATNLPSESVMKKAGMSKIGEFEHPNIAEGHILRPHVLYKI